MTGNSSKDPSETVNHERSATGIVAVNLQSIDGGICNASVSVVLSRLVKKADFEQMLAVPARTRSAHFAVHHIDSRPSASNWRHRKAEDEKLSTADAPVIDRPVDDLPECLWLGTVVPKRHARRSVTRSLLKRQIREAVASHAEYLPAGMWLIRLRAPFVTTQFPSAASSALRHAARAELNQLLTRVKR